MVSNIVIVLTFKFINMSILFTLISLWGLKANLSVIIVLLKKKDEKIEYCNSIKVVREQER